ncbi:MAG: UDP-glucose/GDP-mannose dehydrogenase family protein [Magnetococcales bacterium]|nr:UDP-glucose/GDP-mannose dehydrogenase family protein [Magnetococcales bacterium]
MKISIFGMGYVGCVSAACLAAENHHVIGVDTATQKVDLLNTGLSPVIEAKLPDLIRRGVENGRLSATTHAREAIETTELSLIAVGTPSREDGSLELGYLTQVTREIAQALRDKHGAHTVVIRSTVPPATTEQLILPILLDLSARTLNRDLFVCYNPEFLREGSSVDDFFNPPFTILGTDDDQTFQLLTQLYAGVQGEKIRCTYQAAEAMKTLCNVFHALKITFANEAASILHACGTSAMEAMTLFLKDHKLNLSSAYLRPGFAFGGSCLPKDVRALVQLGTSHGVQTPLLEGIHASNEAHLDRALALIERHGAQKIALLGIAFKPGTDDLRESPALRLAAQLVRHQYDLRIHDPIVRVPALLGANWAYAQRLLPDLARFLENDLDKVLDHGSVWVIAHAAPEVRQHLLNRPCKAPVIDLAGQLSRYSGQLSYTGLCWNPGS